MSPWKLPCDPQSSLTLYAAMFCSVKEDEHGFEDDEELVGQPSTQSVDLCLSGRDFLLSSS